MLDYGEWWYSEMRHIKLIAKKKKKGQSQRMPLLDGTGSLMSMTLDWSWQQKKKATW